MAFPKHIPSVSHTRAAKNAVAITPDDANDLANFAYAGLYIGGAGDVKVDMVDGSTPVTFKAVPVGTVLPIQARRVYAIGTSATLIIALSY